MSRLDDVQAAYDRMVRACGEPLGLGIFWTPLLREHEAIPGLLANTKVLMECEGLTRSWMPPTEIVAEIRKRASAALADFEAGRDG